jgi:branched-chain amino acid transport system substrate-binding protein
LRRINLRTLGLVAVAVAVAAATGCQSGTTGSTQAECGGKIAIFGAFTGGNAGLVLPSLNGAKLAVKQHNAANPNCKVTMVEFDTEGSGDKAAPVANQVAQDQSFSAVIGGHFSGESKATMPIYQAAGLVMVAPSATATELTALGNTSFHRVVANDEVQGAAVGVYFKSVLKSQKVYVVDDATTYGKGVADKVKGELGSAVVGSDKVAEKQTEFAATVAKVKQAGADAIFYSGYTNEAAPFLKQLRGGGVTAKFVGPDGVYDPALVSGAGAAAAEGAIITCPCIPGDKAKGSFAPDFQAEYGQAPGTYAAEGFDSANVLLSGFKAGKKTRKELLDWVNAYDADGVTKHIKFDDKGDVPVANVVIWAYEVKGGQIVPQQEIPKA